MKMFIWIIVAIIIVGGIAWFLSSSNKASDTSSDNNQQDSIDQLSENGRIIDTDAKVFEEIDDAVNALE